MKLKDIASLTKKSERTIQRWLSYYPEELGVLSGKAKNYSREDVVKLLEFVGEDIPDDLFTSAPSMEIIPVEQTIEAEIIELPSLEYKQVEFNEDRHNKVIDSYQQYSKQAEQLISDSLGNRLIDGLQKITREQDEMLQKIRAKSLGEGFQDLNGE